jgi:hypothetical protein
MRNKWFLFLAGIFFLGGRSMAQQADSTALTMEEYVKAKGFVVRDLDNDTYVKFDANKYVAERYEDRKPFYITGDDGNKKRVDLYSLSRKGQPGTIGTLVYYTTEKGKLYTAFLPGRSAPGLVWEKYFEDIHAIDKAEPFFVLKMSYILSKEFSFQQYKASLKGKVPNRAEAATYGNDICFPGADMVELVDGTRKRVEDVRKGDAVVVLDAQTGAKKNGVIGNVVKHVAKNYAITKLLLLKVTAADGARGVVRGIAPGASGSREWTFNLLELEATPNHPMEMREGQEKMGDIVPGQEILCKDKGGKGYSYYTVWDKEETAKGVQPVYSLELVSKDLMIVNEVVVRQK